MTLDEIKQALLPCFSKTLFTGPDTLFNDGHHPSLRGYIGLANDILRQLRERRAFGWPEGVEAPTIGLAECVAHYGLVPVKIAARLRAATAEWPSDELFLVTHRALRNVPRVRALWELLVERVAGRS